MPDTGPAHGITLREASWTWARIAALSFGGPAGQIAVMHRILVEEKQWIGEDRFLHALNYCMLLPGPEAQQLATYIGWLLHKTKGGLIAGGLFVLPGFIAILALSYAYVLVGDVPLIDGIFFGLKAAVIAIVLQAVVRIASRSLKSSALRLLAIAAFVSIFLFDLPFPLIILSAALIGYFSYRAGVPGFGGGSGHASSGGARVEDAQTALGSDLPDHATPNRTWSLKISAVLLFAWLAPVAGLLVTLGPDHVFSRIALFFSQMAVVTFGGAYAVLAYVAQEAVSTFGWLRPEEMIDGLAMAETTPGPLIMVTQFVGFMGALRNSGTMEPLLAATFGAILTTWVTFIPCFLWIFLGAPFVERLRGNQALSASLTAITAAVVGVILNLAIWFALHALFQQVALVRFAGGTIDVPQWRTLNLAALLLTAASIFALLRLKLGVPLLLTFAVLAGIALRVIGIA